MLANAFARKLTADLREEIDTVRKSGEDTRRSVENNTSRIDSLK